MNKKESNKEQLRNAIYNDFWTNDDELRAIDITFEKLFAEEKFVVPEYQRDFIWRDEQLKTILRDIRLFNRIEKEFFIGPAIIQYNENGKIYEVVDGQQRFVTFTIFSSILMNKISKNEILKPEQKDILNKRLKSLIYRDTRGEILRLSIPSEAEDLLKISKGDFTNLKDSWISNATEYISENTNDIEVMDFESVESFVNSYLNIKMAIIKVKKNENPYFAFESINSKGVPLRVSHLFKNFIFLASNNFKYTTKFSEFKETIMNKLYEISKMKEEDEKLFWNQAFYIYYSNKEISKFLGKKKFPSENYEIFNLFKYSLGFEGIEIDARDVEEKYIEILEKLYIIIMSLSTFNDFASKIHLENKLTIEKRSLIYFLYRIKDIKPMVIWAMIENNNFNENYKSIKIKFDNKIISLFKILERIVIWMHVCEFVLMHVISKFDVLKISYKNPNLNTISEMWDELYKSLPEKTKEKISKEYQKDKMTQFDIYKNEKIRSYLIKSLENNYRSSAKMFAASDDDSEYTIDHILCRKSSQSQIKDIDDEFKIDFKSFEDLYMHKIGNLTLNRDKDADADFKDKKFDEAIKISSDLITFQKINDKYTLEQFNQRQENYSAKLYKLFIL